MSCSWSVSRSVSDTATRPSIHGCHTLVFLGLVVPVNLVGSRMSTTLKGVDRGASGFAGTPLGGAGLGRTGIGLGRRKPGETGGGDLDPFGVEAIVEEWSNSKCLFSSSESLQFETGLPTGETSFSASILKYFPPRSSKDFTLWSSIYYVRTPDWDTVEDKSGSLMLLTATQPSRYMYTNTEDASALAAHAHCLARSTCACLMIFQFN